MDFWDILLIIIKFAGAVVVFIYAMKLMSQGLQKVAGNKMPSIMGRMTNHPFRGIITGAAVTAAIQSSTATTVMVVSFVNSGLLSLAGAIAVVMGANIGTTVTSWLILLGMHVNTNQFIITLIICALATPFVLVKGDRMKSVSEFIIGLGILLVGILFLNIAMHDLSQHPALLATMQGWPNWGFLSILIFILIGAALTVVIQVSSAVMAITMVFAASGCIGLDIAVALILGLNIGTTLTANIAARAANTSAKKAARAHFLFNLTGALLTLLLFHPVLNLPAYLARYHPTNTVNFLNSHMPRTDFLYVGVDDDGGEPCSLGVFQNNGSTTNDWNNTMTNTPGRINGGNGIRQTIGDHPRPNPVNILVYMTVDGSHILHSLDGTTFTNEMFMLSVPKGSLNGTNVTYRVDPWYVVGSVTTNGSSAIDSLTPTVTTQPRQYVLSGVGKGASNNVTVVAMAAPDPRIAELGVDEDNEYRDAIVDWLEGGTDLFGNPFADIDGGEIKLAEFRTMNNTFITNMTLTEMYWLDMDPTAGGLALLGGSIMPPPGESDIEHKITRPDGSVSTNIRMAVYMMITNENVALPAPTEHQWRGPNDKYTHWTPYVIRGREPKSNSVDYDDAPGDWASVTFKPTGRLLNNYTSPTNVSNWEPLRLFVFQPDSFTEEGLSRIEIEDPFSFKPFVDWWNAHGPCGIGYFWSIDTRQRQMGVEILRQRNYYGE